MIFCVAVSAVVCGFARPLMQFFASGRQTGMINIGATYLRVEGACYMGIGILFLLYGYYRAVNQPKMSVILTVISLGTRVLLVYVLAKVVRIGVIGIWLAIPIGWLLADLYGILYSRKQR